MNGYASADALDPAADVNRHQSVEDGPSTLQDPTSGYASADALDEQPR
jgi:hypothetical protein